MPERLIIASSCRVKQSLWEQGVRGFNYNIIMVDILDELSDVVKRIKPLMLLLDFDLVGLNGSHDVASLKRLSTETKIIVLCTSISEDTEWELFKTGVRGCCHKEIKPELLQQIVVAVQQGELWMRRTLTCRLLEELGKTTSKNKAYRNYLVLLEKLTDREYNIAVRVGKGESNKQIAKACNIAERTVKAHLTEIFLKLGVTDRLNLALILSADGRRQRRRSPNANHTNDSIS